MMFTWLSHPCEWLNIPSNLYNKAYLDRQWTCLSLRCSWSIACRHCSNYIFIIALTHGFNMLHKGNCKTRRETFKFGDLVRLILDTLWYALTEIPYVDFQRVFQTRQYPLPYYSLASCEKTREDSAYVTSSPIGCELVKPWIKYYCKSHYRHYIPCGMYRVEILHVTTYLFHRNVGIIDHFMYVYVTHSQFCCWFFLCRW